MALVQEEKKQKEEISHVEGEEKQQDERYYIRVNFSDDEDEDPDEYELIPPPRPMTKEETAEYYRQVIESKGFDVQSFEGTLAGGVTPCGINKKNEQLLTDFSKQALQVYNEQNNASFEFDRLVKATQQCVAGFMYYITFAALSRDASRTFRAKVWRKINKGLEVKFCEMEAGPCQLCAE